MMPKCVAKKEVNADLKANRRLERLILTEG